MKDVINRRPLIEKAIDLEKEALEYLNGLDPQDDYVEWIKWNAILAERTAFKYDVMDAPELLWVKEI